MQSLIMFLWSLYLQGGGFHHCSGSSGGGFCVYADITLAIKVVSNYTVYKKVTNAL